MLEQEMNPAAAKFISSLVKSLQILCNGQVDFDECIELVGHINVKVDKVHKFDYIVDEQVSREGNDSSTTFLSNSYHSSPPRKSSQKTSSSKQSDPKDSFENDIPQPNNTAPISLSTFNDPKRKQDSVMVKLEEDENDDCMVLPASPGDYEAVEDINAQESFSVAGPSTAGSESYEMDYDSQVNQFRQSGNKRKVNEQEQDEIKESKVFESRMHPAFDQSHLHQASLFCPTCGQRFYHKDELKDHRRICYNQPSQSFESATSLASQSEDACSCTMCGCILRNSQERLQHMNVEHGVTIYPCPSCYEVFGSSRLLCQHKKIRHGVIMPQLSCPMCKKTFTTALNLRGHMNMHQGLKPYICRKCGDSFAYSQSKHRHQKFCNGTPKLQSWIL